MMKLFVYGTLRKGEGNAHYLKNTNCLAEQCWTYGKLFDTGYGYPALKMSHSSQVYGELYAISDSELKQMDKLEDFNEGGSNNLYERVEQTIYTDNGPITAYVYIGGQSHLLNKRIPDGDWKEYRLLNSKHGKVPYFAYGSCMDHKRFIEHGKGHYFQNMLGVGVLENYSLRFTRKSTLDGLGRADIVEEGGRVEGKVYKIPIEALTEYLYHREGAPHVYRATFVTINLEGVDTQAITFTVKNKSEETAPPVEYEEEILRGAHGYLSDAYMENLKSHMNSLKNLIEGGKE